MFQGLQLALDRAVQSPQWAGFLLLALAAAITVPGRPGQRVLNAVLLGATLFVAAFLGLRPFHPWLPGVAGIVAGTLGAVFGAVSLAWGTAATLAVLFGLAALGCARLLGLHWMLAVPAFGFGLLVGIRQNRRVTLLLPPIFSALFTALGAAVAWAPNAKGAVLYPLNDVRWTMALALLLVAPFLALSLARERRTRRKIAARTKVMDDEDLVKALEQKREKDARHPAAD